MLFNKIFDVGTVICLRAVLLAQLSQGQITVPVLNLLFDDNFIA